MTSPSSDAALKLREPALAFAGLALLLLFVIAVLLFTWTASDFRALNPLSLRVLSIPSLLGTGLAGFTTWQHRKRGEAMNLKDLAFRGAVSMGAAGFAWPLSFSLAVLLQGDAHGALFGFVPAIVGLGVGAFAGALGGALAAKICFTR